MRFTERVAYWLRSIFGGGGQDRRLPAPVDYEPVPEAAVPIGPATPMGSRGTPSIALRRNAVFAAFNTAVPVSDRHGLAGRARELSRLHDAVVRQQKHAIIFGPRGSGKTSLARVFGDLADEAGCVALYGSASAGTDIDGLFRSFLAELPLHHPDRAPALAAAPPMNVQQLAAVFVESVAQRTLLIVDEFDRVVTERTRHDVAALLKLLTDMHSPVQVVLVGIAGNVDGLIASHPSLRRHLFAQAIGPIERDDLAGLLRLCAEQAGMPFEDKAIQTIVSAAIGSPYHARLFGMHAALAAEVDGRDRVTLADAQRGLAAALDEWRDLTPELYALFERALAEAGPLRGMIALAGVLAAHAPVLTFERLTAAGIDLFGEELGGVSAVDRVLGLIAPALCEAGLPGELQFEDSLAPQFLVLIANGIGREAGARPAPRREAFEARELLQGVGL